MSESNRVPVWDQAIWSRSNGRAGKWGGALKGAAALGTMFNKALRRDLAPFTATSSSSPPPRGSCGLSACDPPLRAAHRNALRARRPQFSATASQKSFS